MIFVDTSALYALLNQADDAHGAAVRTWKTLTAERAALHTTNYVVSETTGLVQARAGMGPVRRFYDDIVPIVHMHFVDEPLHEAAVELLLAENRRYLSLVDCSSFVFMRRAGIRRAFAFDDDFKRSGFEVL